jgi:hypothetical protein
MHAPDDRAIESQVQACFVRFDDAANDQDIVVARDQEDDIGAIVHRVRRACQRVIEFRERGAVVADAEEGAADGVA